MKIQKAFFSKRKNTNNMKRLFITLLIIFSVLSIKSKLYSQVNIYPKTQSLESYIDTEFTKGLDNYNIPGAIFVLIQGDSIRHINAYGVSDIETQTPVDSKSSIFRIGSVSKTIVATAVMQLYEDGKLKLDNDINNYLKSFQIEYKFNDSITVENLLTNTAGIDQRHMGWVVDNEKDVIPLAEYFKKRMPPQIRPAGKVMTYSNHGFGLLALIVEEVSGIPFYEYVDKMIAKPLKMNSSGFKKQKDLESNYAMSYLQKRGKLLPFDPVFMLNYPTGSFSSTAPEMGNYISMFLNHGKFQGVQVLDSTTVVKMHQEAFKHYDESTGGRPLGFFKNYWNGYDLIGHMGMFQGFNSDLVLIPEKNAGFFVCINATNLQGSPGASFLFSIRSKLLEMLIPRSSSKKQESLILPKPGIADEPLKAFAGTYRRTWYPLNTLDKFAVLIGYANEFEIVANDSILEIVGSVDELSPVSGLKFITSYGKYVAFGRNEKGEISYYFDNGESYHKLKWYEPLKIQSFWLASIVLILLISIIASIVGRLYFNKKKSHLIKKVNLLFAALIILFIAMYTLVLVTTEPSVFFYGIPLLLKIALLLPFFIIASELYSIYLLIKAIRYKELGFMGLIYHSIILITGLAFIPLLIIYNLIGFNS
ncbi:MAG: serine hydrolase domain-containing protein [Clostridiales bacterium]